jgi:hypothetical protein
MDLTKLDVAVQPLPPLTTVTRWLTAGQPEHWGGGKLPADAPRGSFVRKDGTIGGPNEEM